MKITREFNTLSKRHKVAVGIASVIMGIGLYIGSLVSAGSSLDAAIHDASVMVAISLFLNIVLGIFYKLKLFGRFHNMLFKPDRMDIP